MVTVLHVSQQAARYPNLFSSLQPCLTKSLGSKVRPLPRGLFAWIPQIWRATDDEVLEVAGLDAYVVSSPAILSF